MFTKMCSKVIVTVLVVSLAGITATGEAQEAAEQNTARLETSTSATTIEVGLLGIGERRNEIRPGITEWVQEQIRSFGSAHPGTKVQTLNIDDERWERPIELAPALPRNVIGISSEAGHEVAYLAIREQIVPIDTFLPDPEFSKDDYYQNQWAPVEFGGKTWGVPFATTVAVLVCDWPLFEAEGIVEPPKTWEEFITYIELLTKDTDGDGTIDQVGCDLMPGAYAYITGHIIMQRGIKLFTADGYAPWCPEMTEPFGIVGRIRDTISKRKGPVSPTARCAMTIGRTRNDFAAPFNTGDYLRGAGMKRYRIAYLPTCGQDVLADFDTLYLAVRRSTPELQAASWEFIKWMTRKDAPLPKGLGGYPARKDFLERADFQALMKNSCQGLDILWKSNERLVAFGPHQMVGRYAGLWELQEGVAASLEQGVSPEHTYNETVQRLNREGRILKMPGGGTYELFN